MGKLNELIHQPARLRIMASLIALKPDEQLEFTALGRLLQLTDGNLGAHLLKLEEAGYIKVEKTFVDRKPRTYLKASHRGRAEFETHVEALRSLLDPNPSLRQK